MMKLSLSVRVAEAPCKTQLNVPFTDVLQLAVDHGYQAVCLRASAGGVQTPLAELRAMRQQVEAAVAAGRRWRREEARCTAGRWYHHVRTASPSPLAPAGTRRPERQFAALGAGCKSR